MIDCLPSSDSKILRIFVCSEGFLKSIEGDQKMQDKKIIYSTNRNERERGKAKRGSERKRVGEDKKHKKQQQLNQSIMESNEENNVRKGNMIRNEKCMFAKMSMKMQQSGRTWMATIRQDLSTSETQPFFDLQMIKINTCKKRREEKRIRRQNRQNLKANTPRSSSARGVSRMKARRIEKVS